jgi:hypothetical protein
MRAFKEYTRSNMQQKISDSQYILYNAGRAKLLHKVVFNKMLHTVFTSERKEKNAVL